MKQTFNRRTVEPDIRVENHGSVINITGTTKIGRDWLDENVDEPEGWQGSRHSFFADHRIGIDILNGAFNAGLRVVSR